MVALQFRSNFEIYILSYIIAFPLQHAHAMTRPLYQPHKHKLCLPGSGYARIIIAADFEVVEDRIVALNRVSHEHISLVVVPYR
jgi:hypothetical protein